MPEGLKTRSIKGLLWSTSESIGVAALSLGSFVVMARLLEPADFGAVALASAFIICFNLVVAHSFADSVVLHSKLQPSHLDTAFWSTLLVSLALAAATYGGSDSLAEWLGEARLAELLPWLALVLVLNGIGMVPIAIFRRELRFRTLAISNLLGRSAGAAAGVAMAILDYGAWSLVGQQLVAAIVTNTAVFAAARWWPRFRFSLAYLRGTAHFGFHVSASQVVGGLGEQALNLLVGTIFGSVVLGHFSIAWRMIQLIRSLIATAVYQVAFSAFARLRDDRPAFIRAFEQATRMSCFVGFPISIGLALTAEPAMLTMFGSKWTTSIPLFAILALEMLPAFFLMFFSAAYRAMNRPAWALATALLYFGLGIGGIFALSPLGITAVTAFWALKSFILMPVHLILMGKMLDIRIRSLLAPALRPAAATILMAGAVGLVLLALEDQTTSAIQLIAAVITGIAGYIGAVLLIAPDLVRSLVNAGNIMLRPVKASDPAQPPAPANDAAAGYRQPKALMKSES